jgi:hypothetical protein
VTLVRTCKLCGSNFDLEYQIGRPREYCFVCEPVGRKLVKVTAKTAQMATDVLKDRRRSLRRCVGESPH